eukprot:TRINITY_DN54977_c0_g1_i1.p1 TRINITY_DN54977_c0_g1~~TRINITY_DN54977_c0_g1_i1.p1  ORF type:complete len:326 (-),score=26.25 TRINITY_DN54977_c0_g1_i1:434-1330(-)
MVAATVVPMVLNWTDYIKTRMQGVPCVGCNVLPYAGGFVATGRRMLIEEGVIALWSTGMLASLGRECTTIGVRMGAYPAVRDAIASLSSGKKGGEAGLGNKFTAGVVLGALSGFLATPFDFVRIRVQAEAGVVDGNNILTTGLRAGLPQRVRGTVHAFSKTIEEGFSSLFRGSGVNVTRSICMTVGTVPVYEHCKHVAKHNFDVQESPSLHLGAGMVAGLVGTTVTAPADVIRTRIMQDGKGGVGFFGALVAICREQGARGFFRGWVPAYMRVGPLFLGMPALVEQVRKRLFGLEYIV